MFSSSLRWVVPIAILVGSIGCESYTAVSRKEFRTIVFNQSSNDDVVLVNSDDQYDYYEVGDKGYKVAHREPFNP